MEDELVLVELCTLKCNHVLCRNTIVPVDSSVSTHLKEMTYEWDTTFVKNFTILLYHLYGHPNHIMHMFIVQGHIFEEEFRRDSHMQHLILTCFVNRNHFILVDVDFVDKHIIFLDGFQTSSQSLNWRTLPDDKNYVLHFIPIHERDEWTFIADSYIRQSEYDIFSCGSIAILAFYRCFTGDAYVGESPSDDFSSEMKQMLVDRFNELCFNLITSDELVPFASII